MSPSRLPTRARAAVVRDNVMLYYIILYYVYVCIYIYIYICTYTYIYIYIYIIKGEVLRRGVSTLRYVCPTNASVQWQPGGLTVRAKKWFLGAGFLGAPPINHTNDDNDK